MASVSVSYTHLDVYKRQITSSVALAVRTVFLGSVFILATLKRFFETADEAAMSCESAVDIVDARIRCV